MAADRGRDFTVKVVTDTAGVDLDPVADALDDIATASTDAARDLERTTDELKRVAAEGKDAESELARLDAELRGNQFDQYGKDAADAARKVDAAMDKIAKSAKASMDKVDREGHEGFKDFKQEAASSGRESAASFSGGFEDVTDTVQEIAANAFAGFGAVGAAAGLAAAVGLGAITQAVTAANERLKELGRSFADVKIEGGGLGDTVKVVLDDLREADELGSLARNAKAFGIEWGTMVRAMAGSKPDIQAVNDRLDELESSGFFTGKIGSGTQEFDDVASAIGRSGHAMDDAVVQARAYTEGLAAVTAETKATEAAQAAATKATEDAAAAEAEHQSWLATTRQAIEDVGDAAVQRAVDEAKSIDDIIAAQDKALRAQREFGKNTAEVLDEVGQAGVDWANQFGENAPKAMQMLADAPKSKQAEIVKQYKASGKIATASTAEGMDDNRPKVVSAAKRAHDAAAAQLEKSISIPVDINGAGSAAAQAAREMEVYFRNHPVEVALTPGPGFRIDGRKVT